MKNFHIQPQRDDLAQPSTTTEKDETQEARVQQRMGRADSSTGRWNRQEEPLSGLEASLSGPPPHTELSLLDLHDNTDALRKTQHLTLSPHYNVQLLQSAYVSLRVFLLR